MDEWWPANRHGLTDERAHGEHAAAALPTRCAERSADLLRPDWYPKIRHGLAP